MKIHAVEKPHSDVHKCLFTSLESESSLSLKILMNLINPNYEALDKIYDLLWYAL